jgi:hypothetical protein
VTEEKLLLFLVEDVTARPLRAKSRKADDDVPSGETRLAWRSVRSYVTAVTDLYRAQKAMGMNSHPSPREASIREYLKTLQRQDSQRQKEQFADKGRDTLLDGYTEDEFESVCRELWAKGAATSPECHFRTLVDILLGHYMLTRGGDRRGAEISDLFTFEFKGEGPTRCMPLIFTTRGGKQNQHGRLETIGALRNRKPLVCMLGGLAFYLLYRWDLGDEPFLDFSTRAAWYNVRLIKGSTQAREAAFSYNSQREWVAKAFQYAGIISQKKTHIGRSAGAKMAELKGVSEDQIRRAGRWNQEQMVGCYLNSLPREFMRSMAGHPSQMGCFEIRRASVTPPDELLSMIWPGLDAWKGRFGPQADQINDLAATGATSLLLYLREVVLQDSVALRSMFPGHPVWHHPVFQHPAYAAFAQKVEACMHDGEGPSQLSLLYQAMPLVVDHLKAIDARNEQRVGELRALLDRVAESQCAQSAQLQSLTSGGLTFRLERAPWAEAARMPLPALPAPPAAPTAEGSSSYTSAQTSVRSTPSRIASPLLPDRDREPAAEPQMPIYRMSRTVRTVRALWQEWTVGLGPSSPPVAALDSKWGSRWRAGRQSELQWYSLRLEVIKEIRRVAQAHRVSEEAAMWQVNLQQEQMRCSLDQLCKRLRAGRRACK